MKLTIQLLPATVRMSFGSVRSGVRPQAQNAPFPVWLWRFFRKLGTRKRPGVVPVALCCANCPHFRAKLAHRMALQPSRWPIGVRTFRNRSRRGYGRRRKTPNFRHGSGVFSESLAHENGLECPRWPIGVRTFRNRGATRAEKHPIFGMAREFFPKVVQS